MYMCNVCMVYGLAFFVPTILVVSTLPLSAIASQTHHLYQSLGYSGLQANLHSAPPYMVAVGFLAISSYAADKMQRRLPIIIIQACISILGLART